MPVEFLTDEQTLIPGLSAVAGGRCPPNRTGSPLPERHLAGFDTGVISSRRAL